MGKNADERLSVQGEVIPPSVCVAVLFLKGFWAGEGQPPTVVEAANHMNVCEIAYYFMCSPLLGG